MLLFVCFFQAEDGIRDLVRSRGLGDVYKRQQFKQLLALKGIREKETVSLLGDFIEKFPYCQTSRLSLIHI